MASWHHYVHALFTASQKNAAKGTCAAHLLDLNAHPSELAEECFPSRHRRAHVQLNCVCGGSVRPPARMRPWNKIPHVVCMVRHWIGPPLSPPPPLQSDFRSKKNSMERIEKDVPQKSFAQAIEYAFRRDLRFSNVCPLKKERINEWQDQRDATQLGPNNHCGLHPSPPCPLCCESYLSHMEGITPRSFDHTSPCHSDKEKKKIKEMPPRYFKTGTKDNPGSRNPHPSSDLTHPGMCIH